MSYRIGDNVRYMHPLKKEIYRKGYTVTEFADLCGVTRFTLNSIFKNQVNARGGTIYLISQTLDEDFDKVAKLCERKAVM